MKLLTLIVCLAVSAFAADVAGKWQFTVEFDQGGANGMPMFEFKQSGAALTGTYKGPLGELPASGKTEGDAVTISVKGKRDNGDDISLTYTGKVDNAKKMTGRLAVNGSDAAKWTAVKQ